MVALVSADRARPGDRVRRPIDTEAAEDELVVDLRAGILRHRLDELRDLLRDGRAVACIERPVGALEGKLVGSLDQLAGAGERRVHGAHLARRGVDVPQELADLG